MSSRSTLPFFLPVLLCLFTALPTQAQQATLVPNAPAKSQVLDCPARLNIADLFTYESGITNSGSNAAQGVFLEATITGQLAFDSLRTTLGTWARQDSVNARLDIGTLPGNTRVDFEIDLLGVMAGEGTFELTLGQTGGQDQSDSCTIAVFNVINVDGNIVIDGAATLTIDPFIELRLIGEGDVLEMNDGATIDGEGFIVFAGPNQTLFLGERPGTAAKASGGPALHVTRSATLLRNADGTPGLADTMQPRVSANRAGVRQPSSASTATVQNLRFDTGDTVEIEDDDDADTSDLIITNRLEVQSGQLNINANNLVMVGPTNAGGTGGVHIERGTVIRGGGVFTIAVDPASLGGPANTREGAYRITGEGNLNVAFDKTTDAGVLIELGEIGAGSFSFNRAGALFVPEAIQLNGSFRNTGAARTEFGALREITTNLEIEGPGGEVFPTDGNCNGNESGVFFFAPVTVEGDLALLDSDDPNTACQVEGLFFLADNLDPGETAFSVIEGDVAANGAAGLFLDFDNPPFAFHNVAFEGDFIFNEAPTFLLNAPANAFPVGDLDVPYTIEAPGNKVRFSSDNDQLLSYEGTLNIQSVQIQKEQGDAEVEIDRNAGLFVIDTSLEILRGAFVTHGLLSAEGTATVVLNQDQSGSGRLEAGSSDRAFRSDDPTHIARKVTYTGNRSRFTGDEIPGGDDLPSGEKFVPFLEVFLSAEDAVITLGKDFTLGPADKTGGRLIITRGILDVGSSRLRLSNTLAVEIGDGAIQIPDQVGARGRIEFPTDWIPEPAPSGFDRPFRVGEDGIDLLYFGTTDRTVGPEWPAAVTAVPNRRQDPDVIRDVTIDPAQNRTGGKAAAPEAITIALRAEDGVYRINGLLVVAEGSTLDPAGTVLEGGGTFAVQVIHNAPDAGPLDLYINNALVLDDMAFQTASAYLPFPAGQTTFRVTNEDGSTTLAEGTTTLSAAQSVTFLWRGLVSGTPVFQGSLFGTRQTADNASQVEFFFAQGAPDAPTLDVRTLDPTNSNMPLAVLADDIAYSQRTNYLSLPAAPHTIEVSTADNSTQLDVWRFDLSGREGQTFALLGSGLISDGSFTLIGFDKDGTPILPDLVTATDAGAALPETFALHGNYPNPFNPTTTLRFDLPERATVRAEVFDVLGRMVLNVPPRPFDAGAGHALSVDASALASGVYLYRLVAQTDARTLARPGQMILAK